MTAARGITLVEVAVGVAFSGAVLAITAFYSSASRVQRAETSSYATLTALHRAAQVYHNDNASLPGDERPGIFPKEFATYVDARVFHAPPPLRRALWDWNNSDAAPWKDAGPNFSIWQQTSAPAPWQRFDKSFDDASVSTGGLRLLNGGKNYCLVQEW